MLHECYVLGHDQDQDGAEIVVQSFSRVRLFVTPWTAAHQASLSITNSWSLFKLISIESVILSNHLIFCHLFLLLPSIFPSIRVFSSELALHIRWPKDWSFSTSPWSKNSLDSACSVFLLPNKSIADLTCTDWIHCDLWFTAHCPHWSLLGAL